MLKDLVYAIRTLRKSPGFVAVVVCSLAIGIGTNSAIYAMAETLLLRPLQIADPDRVVCITPANAGVFGAQDTVSYTNYVDVKARASAFDGVIGSAFAQFGFAVDQQTQPSIKFGLFVSGNFFKVLGLEPAIGRSFRPDEDQAPGRDAVVVISHDLWMHEFEGSASAIGKRIRLSGTEFTIIGVAPKTFSGLGQVKTALYVPLAMAGTLWSPNMLTQRENRWLTLRGRLKHGVSLAQASSNLAAIAAGLRQEHPAANENFKLKAESELQYRAERAPMDVALVAMLGLLALCVLGVACANVVGLLLGRLSTRAFEISLRMAIGAGRWVVIRQLFIENLLLAGGGFLAGLLVADGAVAFFNSLQMAIDAPLDYESKLDGRAILFTAAIAAFSTFLFGLAPALRTTKQELVEALKERDVAAFGHKRLRGRSVMLTGQVALSLLLLVVTGVMLDGFYHTFRQGPGFRVDHLQLIRFDPGVVHYTDTQSESFYKRLLDTTKLSPAIQSSALTSAVPLLMGSMQNIGVLQDDPRWKGGNKVTPVFHARVTPEYFRTMDISLVHGRGFLESDKVNTPLVGVVNETFARHWWSTEDPVGKRIRLYDRSGPEVQVVGVVRTSKCIWVSESPADFLYLPFSQNPSPAMSLIAQSKSPDAASLAPILKSMVQHLDPNMPVYDVRTMYSIYENDAVECPTFITEIAGAMGLMTLVLSALGLYAVVSYWVSKRTREIGIRMAIGANRKSVIRMVLRQGLVAALTGLGIGLILSVFAARALAFSEFFFFEHVSVLPFIGASVLMLLTTVIAAYLPAQRASRIDPMLALREE